MRSVLHTIRICLGILDASARRRWAWLVALGAIAGLLETMGGIAVFGLINVVADIRSLGRVPVIGPWLTALSDYNHSAALLLVVVAVVVFFVAKNLFLALQIYNQEKVAYQTTSWVTSTLMRGYLHVPYAYHFRRNSAEAVQRLEYAVDDVFKGGLLSAVVLLSELFITIGLVIILLVSEPVVSLVTAVCLGLLATLTLRFTQRAYRHVGERLIQLGAAVVKAMQQAMGAVKEIKVLGREDHFADTYGAIFRERTENQRKTAFLGQVPRLVSETLMVAAMALIVGLAMLSHEDQTAALPILGLFGYVGFRLQPSLNRMIMHINNITKAAAPATSLARDWPEFLAAAQMNLRHPAAVPFERDLVIENLHYTYPEGDQPVLKGIDFSLKRGESIGIVGASGAGKSTLVDIILGLLTPTAGYVLVDGRDISKDPRAWQRKIGYVPQSIYLTDDTLRRNVAFGLPDHEIDEAALALALSMAQLSDFVAELPHGAETRIGERGIMLSGGQRQRIGVARALYDDPELLVFDEATSALDAETEHEVAREIEALAGRKTIILIAHRFSTLRNCDRIILLKDGKVAASGTQQELLNTSIDYQRMSNLSTLQG